MRPSVIMYVPSLSIAPLNNPLSFMCSSQTLVALTAYVIRFALNIMTILFCNKTRKWEFYFCQLNQFSALHSQGCCYCHSTPPLPQHTAVFLQTMSEWPVVSLKIRWCCHSNCYTDHLVVNWFLILMMQSFCCSPQITNTIFYIRVPNRSCTSWKAVSNCCLYFCLAVPKLSVHCRPLVFTY